MDPRVTAFFDPATYTISYIVAEPDGDHCAIIDSVLDYNPRSGRVSHSSADQIIAHVRENDLTVDWILETHAHADHLTAAPYLIEAVGGKTGIGEHVTQVQEVFKGFFNLESEFPVDGSQFDHLFTDGEEFQIGAMAAQVMHTPGHTPACITYLIGNSVFVGDTMFMPDYGTARCDFPGGDAAALYNSIGKIFGLSADTKLYMCHDYMAPGRDFYAWETTVAAQVAENIMIREGVGEDTFVAERKRRDADLEAPVLLLPSVQVNIRAGHIPPPEGNGVSYLKIPIRD
jgi:glyoxylase-like metal-dependent hydrolase (beta-lactamase superfamily II)